jgi:glycosyltransferase involved in cell wall biosynthesis
MAVGVPVLAFNCPHGPREILGENAGSLIPALNVEALAEAMAQRLTQPLDAAARQALQARVEGYRATVSAQRYRRQILMPG